jgi:outer membrane immunogenic protein
LVKNFLVAATLAISLSGTAHAADIYRKAPPAPVANWTGFYAGVNAGGGWSSTGVGYAANDPLAEILLEVVGVSANGDRFKSSGAFGGVQAGYNYQFNRNWVAGLETDFQISDIKGSGTTPYPAFIVSTSANQDIKYFGTVRARLGYLATDDLLVYATGGFAYARLNNAASYAVDDGNTHGGIAFIGGAIYSFNCGVGIPNTCFAASSDSVSPGWTAGGGLEYAFSRNWSLKGEYLYARFQQTLIATAVTPVPGTTPASYRAKFATDLNIARVGLNYRF